MQQRLNRFAGFLIGMMAWNLVMATDAQLLVYRVTEPGQDPYISRMLVTPGFVRLDEGGDPADGYTLFQRGGKAIYNVSPEERTITVMQATGDVPVLPPELHLREQVEVDEQAPKVGGAKPVRVQLFANDRKCRELMVVPGIMTAAVQGLKEFRQVLAMIQGARLDTWPEASRTPCDLAELIYAPVRGLSHGLPLQDHGAGMNQSLLDFVDAYPVENDLFLLPADYERIRIPGL